MKKREAGIILHQNIICIVTWNDQSIVNDELIYEVRKNVYVIYAELESLF